MNIVLPDGAIKSFDGDTTTGMDVAKSIGSSLAKVALAVVVNGEQRDLCDPIADKSSVAIITKDSAEGLEIMRHTVTAQLLARAVKTLYPSAKLAIGPTIKDGFYYDIAFEKPLSSDDLGAIEKEMRRIAGSSAPINKKIYSKSEAIAMFKERDEPYKVDIIERADSDEFQIYHQGDTDFIDLCRGPHLPALTKVGAFKLLKIAGAYWRGDSNNEMLTRIYGTAWLNDKDLKDYLHRMEEAEKRDHRKIGGQMDLFHIQPESPGQVFWHDKGWTIFKEIENYIRGKLKNGGYQEVNTPRVVNKSLYVASGHWEKFGTDEMFVSEAYDSLFALKPMNCPCHVQIFNHTPKSYRDLPVRMAEFGNCYRQEARGALHGLMRVSSMTQDDAHIFCRMDQIKDEVIELNKLIAEIYSDFGFEGYFVRFSDRPEQRVGSDEVWDAAEQGLKDACAHAGIEWQLNPGEGAFYGPKLEFVLTDAIGREWQCGTIQLDFNLPKRLDAFYINEHGDKENPVMIHRALIGTIERFMGILIEHYAGHFPLWLSPTQIVLTGITEKNNDYALSVMNKMRDNGIRAVCDTRNESLNYKIRDNLSNKVSMVGVVGDKETSDNTVTIRRLGENKQDTHNVDDLITSLKQEIAAKK